MKNIFAIWVVAVSMMTTASCHRKLQASHMSCCAKDEANNKANNEAKDEANNEAKDEANNKANNEAKDEAPVTAPGSESANPTTEYANPTAESGNPSADRENPSPGLGNMSVYQLPSTWTNQHNQPLALDQLKGKVQVMAMIYTSCGYACPRIVQDMKAIEDTLPGNIRKNVGFVLVSLDSKRDDPAQLARYARQQGLGDRWVLLHGTPGQVRELSMLLNVKYREGQDHRISHSNEILILDSAGTVRKSIGGLEPQTGEAIAMIHRLVNR